MVALLHGELVAVEDENAHAPFNEGVSVSRSQVLVAWGLGLLSCVVTTGEARGQALDASWLIKPAEKAVLSNQLHKAAVLYNGALALRGSEPGLHWRLAEIHAMGGQRTLALQSYGNFIKVSKDAQKRARARAELRRLAHGPAHLVTTAVPTQVRQRSFALEAARRARKRFGRKEYRAAIRYYEAALIMDSSLQGVFRLLGAAYAKLRDKKRSQAFYFRYLRLRPGGKLADLVRKRLRGNKQLARITFKASFGASVYLNRLSVRRGKKTPLKNVLLPAGTYTVVLHHRRYHAAWKLQLRVRAADRRTVTFHFGVLITRLKPWARIRANGRDLGLWSQIGLPAGRYRLVFQSDDGSKKMIHQVRITSGKKLRFRRWK